MGSKRDNGNAGPGRPPILNSEHLDVLVTLTHEFPHVNMDELTRILIERRPGGLRAAGAIFGGAVACCEGRLLVARMTLGDAARLGVGYGDLEGIVDRLVFTTGVEVAVLLIERSEERVKLSLRAEGASTWPPSPSVSRPQGAGMPRRPERAWPAASPRPKHR